MRMAGQMGNVKATTLNLKVVEILPDDNAILVSGCVPGADGTLVIVRHSAKSRRVAANSSFSRAKSVGSGKPRSASTIGSDSDGLPANARMFAGSRPRSRAFSPRNYVLIDFDHVAFDGLHGHFGLRFNPDGGSDALAANAGNALAHFEGFKL